MSKTTLTFDWNCVIDVVEKRPQARFVQKLVDAHRGKKLEASLLSISASENEQNTRCLRLSYESFSSIISDLGWDDLPILNTPGIWGITYWGHSVYADSSFNEAKVKIWDIIARNIDMDPRSHLAPNSSLDDGAIKSRALAKWRNALCDVVSAYTHIHNKRDIFVTSNIKDFQKHSEALAKLGMHQILTPELAFKALNLL